VKSFLRTVFTGLSTIWLIGGVVAFLGALLGVIYLFRRR